MPSRAIERRLLGDEEIRRKHARAAAHAALLRLQSEGIPAPSCLPPPAAVPAAPSAEEAAAALLTTAGSVSAALAAIAADLRGLNAGTVSGSSSDSSATIREARAAACDVLRNAKRSLDATGADQQDGLPPFSARRIDAAPHQLTPAIPVSLERTLDGMDSNPGATLQSLCALVLTNWEHDFNSLQFVARTLWHMTRERPGQAAAPGNHPGGAPPSELSPVGQPPALAALPSGHPVTPIESVVPRPSAAPAAIPRRPRRTGWHTGDLSTPCQGFSPALGVRRSRSSVRAHALSRHVPDSDIEAEYEEAS
jgi:hypothetical protein